MIKGSEPPVMMESKGEIWWLQFPDSYTHTHAHMRKKGKLVKFLCLYVVHNDDKKADYKVH